MSSLPLTIKLTKNGQLFKLAVALLLPLILLLQGCASSLSLVKARQQFYAGQTVEALETLDTANLPARSRLLELLDRGLILHTQGDYAASTLEFRRAVALLDSKDFISIREQSASLVTNDWALTYKGEYSERLWIHAYQMMNYLLLGNAESAAVEARQALAWYGEHSAELKHDWFTRTLIALSFEAAGKQDSAHIEYKKLHSDLGSQSGLLTRASFNARNLGRTDEARLFYAGASEGTEQQQRDASRRNKNSGQLIVFLQSGAIPRKEPDELLVTSEYYLSFPAYPHVVSYEYSPIARPVTLQKTNFSTTATSQLEAISTDTAAVSHSALQARGNRLVAKQLLRLKAKHELIRAAEKKSETLGVLAAGALLLLEQADTRSWETLPAQLSLVEVTLPEGVHDLELDVSGIDGQGILRLEQVNIRAGRTSYRSVRPGILRLQAQSLLVE